MKKVLVVLTVALLAVACNNPCKVTESDKDTVSVVVEDTVKVVKDTLITVDTLR